MQRWVLPRFWFPNLTRLILNCCKTCDICQKFQEKLPDYRFKGLSSISGLFDEFQKDFLGPLPETTDHYKFILVAVDKLSRYPIALPVKDTTANTVVNFVFKEIISRFGVPSILTADRGSSFIANHFKLFINQYGIVLNLVTSYQPEWNGFVERLNKTIRQGLLKISLSQVISNQWDKHLDHLLMSIRCLKSAATNYSPFYLLYGFEPKLANDNSLFTIENTLLEFKLIVMQGCNCPLMLGLKVRKL